jgi:uncharacterized protein with HEPN domain
MTEHDDRTCLKQMLDHATEAIAMAEGRSRLDLDSNRMLELALVRLIEIVGEAANRVSAPTRESMPQIPWRQLVGMRNRVVHGYDSVDRQVLWDTVTTDLPPLCEDLATAIE